MSPVVSLINETVWPFVRTYKPCEVGENATCFPRWWGSDRCPSSRACSCFSRMRDPVRVSKVRSVDPPGPDSAATTSENINNVVTAQHVMNHKLTIIIFVISSDPVVRLIHMSPHCSRRTQ